MTIIQKALLLTKLDALQVFENKKCNKIFLKEITLNTRNKRITLHMFKKIIPGNYVHDVILSLFQVNSTKAHLQVQNVTEHGNHSNSTNLSRLKLEDEDIEETQDLFVTVDNPEKHATTLESYITFRVTTKVYICEIHTVEPVL